MEYPVAARLDIDAAFRAMASAGGPAVSPVRPLPGGAVGAWEVVRQNGASSVLTWRGPQWARDNAAAVPRAAELVEVARRVGVPHPYEDVVPLADGGVVVLQEFVVGVPPELNVEVITSLLELTDRRRGVLKGTGYENEHPQLYLLDDGPGFCLHAPAPRPRPSSTTTSRLDRGSRTIPKPASLSAMTSSISTTTSGMYSSTLTISLGFWRYWTGTVLAAVASGSTTSSSPWISSCTTPSRYSSSRLPITLRKQQSTTIGALIGRTASYDSSTGGSVTRRRTTSTGYCTQKRWLACERNTP